MDKRQVVGRSVVFRECPMLPPHQAANRQVKAGRTILSLVVPIRKEVNHLMRRFAMLQNVFKRSVDGRIASPAALIGKEAIIAYACQDNPMSYAGHGFRIPA